ncbi:hypothetical protein [Streptomyces sp. NPDC006739]|uniref:hypothetical protein n=1 Tax=Streptomyces sp. NPDC006739 TaxID=3364763 RepID=UPI0036A90A93
MEPADQRRDNEDWVVGVLVANPYYENDLQPPDDWPSDLESSGVIFCGLRSHHPLNELKERYELWSYELARTSDVHALHVIAEWWPAEDKSARRGRPLGAESDLFSVVVVEELFDGPTMPNASACGAESFGEGLDTVDHQHHDARTAARESGPGGISADCLPNAEC